MPQLWHLRKHPPYPSSQPRNSGQTGRTDSGTPQKSVADGRRQLGCYRHQHVHVVLRDRSRDNHFAPGVRIRSRVCSTTLASPRLVPMLRDANEWYLMSHAACLIARHSIILQQGWEDRDAVPASRARDRPCSIEPNGSGKRNPGVSGRKKFTTHFAAHPKT